MLFVSGNWSVTFDLLPIFRNIIYVHHAIGFHLMIHFSPFSLKAFSSCTPVQSAYNDATRKFCAESLYSRKSTTSNLVSDLCSLWLFNYSLPAACVCCFSHLIPFVNAVLDWMPYRAITDKLLMTYTQAITHAWLISFQRPLHSVHNSQAATQKTKSKHFLALICRLDEWALLKDFLFFCLFVSDCTHLYTCLCMSNTCIRHPFLKELLRVL